MKNLYVLILFIFTAFLSSAQSSKVTGIVTDANGPLPGASILVKGTAIGTQTDFDGNFEITAKIGDELIISYVGYETKNIEITSITTPINVLLEEDSQVLEEVVVMAYGVSRKKSITSAITTVSSNEIQQKPSYDVSTALQGQVAGISITNHINRIPKDKRILVKEAIKQKKPADYIYIVDEKAIPQVNNSIVEKMHPSEIVQKHIYKPSRAKNVFGISGNKGCIVINTLDGDYKIEDQESYAAINENKFEQALLNPLSTFSIDVDKASYSNVRRMINNGQEINSGAVKIEELINYFDYDYPQPKGKHPFNIHTELTTTPWNSKTKLVRIGLQGKEYAKNDLPPSNLTFLIDVSGSMSDSNKLPLLKKAFKLLVKQMRAQDKVAIVVYAGAAGVVLEPTKGTDKNKIIAALDNLEAGGSTAGGEGIELAYKIATENFIKRGNNRVILATDGDFNVGASSDDAMEKLIEKKRSSGVFLSVLGFGMGNYKDSKLELLADKGNGNHAYIDTMSEAQKIFGKEFGGTLHAIAKDVKIQVEFNPALVGAYRLIGYENRLLNQEDFKDDSKDAGEIGANQNVTALYEIVPKEQLNQDSESVIKVDFRYKNPNAIQSKTIELNIKGSEQTFEKSSDFMRFTTSIAAFSMLLSQSQFSDDINYRIISEWLESVELRDRYGFKSEFKELVKKASNLE